MAITSPSGPALPPPVTPVRPGPALLKRFALHLTAATAWSFILVKVFILDVDVLILRQLAPNHAWLLNLKFFWIVGAFLAFWVLARKQTFRKTVLFVTFYPLILLVWYLPRLLFKSSTAVFLVVFALISAFVSVKPRMTIWFIALLSCLGILLSENRYVLFICMLCVFAYLLTHLVRRVRAAFRPVTVFERINRLIGDQWEDVKTKMFRKDISALVQYADGSEDHRKKRAESLQMLLLFNRVFLRIGHQLRRIRESKILIGYFMVSIVYTSLLAVVTFAFGYFALARLSPDSFAGYSNQGMWFFLYFSLNTILRAGSGSFSAESPVARLLTVAEVLVGVFISVILAWLVVSVFLKRYNNEVRRLIKNLAREGKALEEMVIVEHRISVQEAEAEIRQLNKGAADLIVWLTVKEDP